MKENEKVQVTIYLTKKSLEVINKIRGQHLLSYGKNITVSDVINQNYGGNE